MLDTSQAYQQVLLDEPSKKLVVINTSKGLFQYCLEYHVHQESFRVMESLLKGIPGVVVYLDDILVTGLSEEEHVLSLKQITGGRFTTKQKKVSVLASAVTYLGYQTDSEGLHPTDEKLKAVKLAPEPTSVTELKAYLGLLTYYGSFTSPPISYTSVAVIVGTKNLEMLISPTVSLTFHEKHWMRIT